MIHIFYQLVYIAFFFLLSLFSDMFNQQQQRQQQKPNFKFIIRSKVETNINQEPATVEEKKQIEVKQVFLEDDRKRKRAAVEATMTSSKKVLEETLNTTCFSFSFFFD